MPADLLADTEPVDPWTVPDTAQASVIPYATSRPPAGPQGCCPPTFATPIPRRRPASTSLAPAARAGAAAAAQVPNATRRAASFTPPDYTCLPRSGALFGPGQLPCAPQLTRRGGSVISPPGAEEQSQQERAQAPGPVRGLLDADLRRGGELRVVAHARAGHLPDHAGHRGGRLGRHQPDLRAAQRPRRRGAGPRAAGRQRRADAAGVAAAGRRPAAPADRHGAARGGAQGGGRLVPAGREGTAARRGGGGPRQPAARPGPRRRGGHHVRGPVAGQPGSPTALPGARGARLFLRATGEAPRGQGGVRPAG